jgi:Flp pilus assembly protein TadG
MKGAIQMRHRGLAGLLRKLMPGGRSPRFLGGEEGATIVEFAFASTVLMSLLFGLIQTCLAVYCYDFTSQAARDGARYLTVRGAKCTGGAAFGCGAGSTEVQTYLRSENYPALNMNTLTAHAYWYTAAAAPPNMTWTTLCASDTYSAACAAQGNAVKVVVTYPFTLNVPFLQPISISMQNSSQMVISQ